MLYQKKSAAVLALMFCAQGCSIESGSIMEELELPTLGDDSGADDQSLEVPPDLDLPEPKETYDVTSAQQHALDAATAEQVLPQHLDMRLRSEGAMVWLVVSATPDDLWPHLVGFWESHGFEISDESALRGRITTDWREQRLGVADGIRTRDMFLMRVERAPNAATNVYLANRKATFVRGSWEVAFSDRETELEILHDVRDYLASQSAVKSVDMPPLKSVQIVLDIEDLDGVPVLTIGQPYSRVWRRLGVTLDRAGLDVRRVDRSRGVYLIRYRRADTDGDETGSSRLLQLRLQERKDRTLVTVHANRKREAALTYETAHEVLHRIVQTYKVRA